MPLLKPYIPERLYQMLEEEVTRQLELQKSPEYQALPAGAVHADLFRNNALINQNGDRRIFGRRHRFLFCVQRTVPL